MCDECLFAYFGGSGKPRNLKQNVGFLTKTTVPSWPGAGGPSLPLWLPAAPARASPESALARACAMASAYFLVWRLRSVALGLAASRVLQSTEQGVGQRAGGRDRVTGQGASCPAQSTVGPGVVWRQQLPSFTVHTVLRSRPLALPRQSALPSYRRAAPPAPVRRERDGVRASG